MLLVHLAFFAPGAHTEVDLASARDATGQQEHLGNQQLLPDVRCTEGHGTCWDGRQEGGRDQRGHLNWVP